MEIVMQRDWRTKSSEIFIFKICFHRYLNVGGLSAGRVGRPVCVLRNGNKPNMIYAYKLLWRDDYRD